MRTKKWKANDSVWRHDITGGMGSHKVTVHHVKCDKASFDAIVTGRKTAEFRKDDRGYQEHDLLLLYKLNTAGLVEEYSPVHCVEITHVQLGFGLPDDYAMLSVRTYNKLDAKYSIRKPEDIEHSDPDFMCQGCNKYACEC